MTNTAAIMAALEVRGPRCDRCGGWTFRPEYLTMPKVIARLCPDCLPLTDDLMIIKRLAISQVFKSDLPRYPADEPIILAKAMADHYNGEG